MTEEGEFLFDTYIRQILEKPGFVKRLNEEMLQIYLTLTYPGGEDTFFEGVKKLMPGHFLVFENGKLTIQPYWTPEFCPDESRSLEEYTEEIHQTVEEILEEIDEDGTETFLSSGVDSSYLLAMSKAENVHSCGYAREAYDESQLAQQTADMLGRNFCRHEVTPEEYFAEIPYFCENMEQPLGDASGVVFALACQEVAKSTKVCYSGEGCDEFFAGYQMYNNADRYKEHLAEFYAGNTMIMKEEEKRELLLHYKEDFHPVQLLGGLYEEIRDYDPLSKMLRVDISMWLEGDIYLNVDKMSTACGLEVRMPFTDLRLFDIASKIPAKYKLNEKGNKYAFRMAANKVLPEEIAFRKKIGFVVPIRYWLADERYNQDVKEKLFGESAAKFFRREKIEEIFRAYTGGETDLWRKIWTIYIFLVWYDIYFVQEKY